MADSTFSRSTLISARSSVKKIAFVCRESFFSLGMDMRDGRDLQEASREGAEDESEEMIAAERKK